VLGWLGGLFHPPQWVADLSPYHHTPAVPVDPVTLGSPTLVLLAAALLTVLGVLGFRRRDVG